MATESAVKDVNLCAGAGGMALGLINAGFGPLGLYEVDPHACTTLRANVASESSSLDGVVHESDITEVDWSACGGQTRLLAAAVPCQPFSLGGKHLGDRDARNLFPAVLNAIEVLKPQVVLIENVRGLLRSDFRPYFEYVLRQLECPSVQRDRNEHWASHDKRLRRRESSVGYEPEYDVGWRLVDAADYGVPQNRHRVFIVATACRLGRKYRFPKATHSKDALLKAQVSGEYWKRWAAKPTIHWNGVRYDPDDCHLPWRTVREGVDGLWEPADDQESSVGSHWRIPGARSYSGHSGSRLDWPSKAVKAGVHGVPGGENTLTDESGQFRYYTLRETARVQTFPDGHIFEGARLHVTKQIGNAVPVELVDQIASPLFAVLDDEAQN